MGTKAFLDPLIEALALLCGGSLDLCEKFVRQADRAFHIPYFIITDSGTPANSPGLFLWPLGFGFPKSGFIARGRPLGIARPIAFFLRLNVPNQCGAIAFWLPGRANNLNGFHLGVHSTV
jgi:hypothetical protein